MTIITTTQQDGKPALKIVEEVSTIMLKEDLQSRKKYLEDELIKVNNLLINFEVPNG